MLVFFPQCVYLSHFLQNDRSSLQFFQTPRGFKMTGDIDELF